MNASSIDNSMMDYKPPKIESSPMLNVNNAPQKAVRQKKPTNIQKDEGFKNDTSSFSILLDQSIVSNTTPRPMAPPTTRSQVSKGRPPLSSKPQKQEVDVFDKLAHSYLDMKQNNLSSQSPPGAKKKNYTPQGPSPARGKVNDIGMDLDQEESFYKKPNKKLLRDQSDSDSDDQP